ncbi:MAG: single-stranded-DNA-specific exonuclease RecJ [Isosphaeraceae bacterium]
MTPHWRLRPHNADQIAALARGAKLHELVAQILLNRGITEPAQARTFLDPRRDGLHDPETLPGITEAAKLIEAAVRAGRKIIIYGDYDVDGVCGTSILWACLRLAGAADVEYYVPHRIKEGYGLNSDALRTLVRDRGASLIVTVDCGITAVNEARLARELGVELIITDHHTQGADLPEADVVVHPKRPGSTYAFPELCGCGVAFKLAWQLCKSFGDGKKASPHLRDFLIKAINLVALATVADIMPLDGENRIFVRHGLRGLADDGAAVGLKALLQVSGLLGQNRLNSGSIGFRLAPRINAAGRLGSARRAVELLTTDDAELAFQLANELDESNRQRQDLERTIVDQARAMVERSGGLGDRGAIVIGHEGWHAGVIGIVASRLVEIYHRPTIVVSLTESGGQGSARSIPGLNLVEALRDCSEGLTSYGGHAAAAGLRVPTDLFAPFAERFDHHCRGLLTDELKRRELWIDAEVPLGVLTPRVVDALDALEPYGVRNPKPILTASRVRVVGDPRPVGEHKQHLQFRVSQGNVVAKCIAWNMAERGRVLTAGATCSLAFHPSINEWNGRRDVQLEIKDFQLAREDSHALPA